ncbi:hypothetical protein D9758_012747 [Tetrapyrgos nigripes]|uniref:Uncharacterized protein n=1 Tax=Tetrapyrgos nigripes TaxID=182062 RepID=A0A8H5CST6_9AGAR|nr:hypothetical protein D9758_012747 [Tetrapyrgos nigripes]
MDNLPAEAMHANPPDPSPSHHHCSLSCPETSGSGRSTNGPGASSALDSTASTLHEGNDLDVEKIEEAEGEKVTAAASDCATTGKEATELNAGGGSASTSNEVELMHYPDGGLRAWLVVLGCFMYGSSCMGWGLVWGVLQDYYHTDMFPESKLSVLSTIGGLMNFTMTAGSYFFWWNGRPIKMISIGCFLMYACLLASAFSTKVYHVFLFQGGLLGLGQGIALPLYVSLPSQWFDKRRGLATGIAVSGTGIGAGIESLIVRPMLVNLGLRRTMIIYSSMHALVWTIAWFLIKERIPRGRRANTNQTKKRWLPKKVTGSFYSVALSMFFGIFGYLSPYYFSSTYTRQMAPNIDPSSLLISIPLVLMTFCRA